MPRALSLAGQRFTRLVALEPESRTASGGARRRWICRCDCGVVVRVETNFLRRGDTKSCGCLKAERAALLGRANEQHGHTTKRVGLASATYRTWASMRDRCTNIHADSYEYYGWLGVEVCDRWLHSFANFLADMGERPAGTTLDRYPNPNGNYEPGNCRWATPKQQRGNQRERRLV